MPSGRVGREYCGEDEKERKIDLRVRVIYWKPTNRAVIHNETMH